MSEIRFYTRNLYPGVLARVELETTVSIDGVEWQQIDRAEIIHSTRDNEPALVWHSSFATTPYRPHDTDKAAKAILARWRVWSSRTYA
jgi:hypothetical protein